MVRDREVRCEFGIGDVGAVLCSKVPDMKEC